MIEKKAWNTTLISEQKTFWCFIRPRGTVQTGHRDVGGKLIILGFSSWSTLYWMRCSNTGTLDAASWKHDKFGLSFKIPVVCFQEGVWVNGFSSLSKTRQVKHLETRNLGMLQKIAICRYSMWMTCLPTFSQCHLDYPVLLVHTQFPSNWMNLGWYHESRWNQLG